MRVESRFQGSAPARVSGGIVSFEPGARTAWHTHPLGQTLIVTAGAGLLQQWHGATATTTMPHVAIAEQLDGKAVIWMELVSED